jgi:HSP20 family protein
MAELMRWDPFRGAMSLRDAMDRLLEDSFVAPFGGGMLRREGAESLAMDMYETDNDLVVETSLPGVRAEDVDISVVGNTLSIKAETKQEQNREEKGRYYCSERRYGLFQRSVALPVEVDPNKAQAVFENGVLKLTLPKTEAQKPRKIAIKKS